MYREISHAHTPLPLQYRFLFSPVINEPAFHIVVPIEPKLNRDRISVANRLYVKQTNPNYNWPQFYPMSLASRCGLEPRTPPRSR